MAKKPEEPVVAAPAPAALAVVPPVAIAPAGDPPSDFAVKQSLAARLPADMRADVMLLKRPTIDELIGTVTVLPAAFQEKMLALIGKTRPKKLGIHTTAEGFAPTQLKMFHGVGADPARPRQTVPGQFYTGDSRVIGESINAVPLGIHQGRVLWPEATPGAASANKAPVCVSHDRKTGSKYGACASCALADREYTKGGCTKDVTIWMLDEDLTAVYELKVSKTSLGAGESFINVLKKSQNIWDRWFTFKAEARTDNGKQWYVLKITPLTDPKDPAKTNTPVVLHQQFKDLATILQTDVYYPAVADVHDRLKNSPDAGGADAPASSAAFDEKSFLAGDAPANPDYSKDV